MSARVLIVDHYDSFTYNLYQLLGTLGAAPEVAQSDALSPEAARSRGADAILLGPGHGDPDSAQATLELVAALAQSVPFLGVCLGHQALARSFGAAVRRARAPLHGKVTPLVHDGRGLFSGLAQGSAVARYNSLVVAPETLPPALCVTATCPDGEVMAIQHRSLPLWGVQFHPESFLSEDGGAIMRNWLRLLPPRPRR